MTAALLQATSLLSTLTTGTISAVTAAALESAGLLPVVPFPPLTPARLRRLVPAGGAVLEPDPMAHRPMGTQD